MIYPPYKVNIVSVQSPSAWLELLDLRGGPLPGGKMVSAKNRVPVLAAIREWQGF